MPLCSVLGCRRWDTANRPKGTKLHKFPKDETFRTLWFSICGKEDLGDSARRDLRICSAHFLPSDYMRDLKWELLYNGRGNIMENPKRKLKPDSVPSVEVPYPVTADIK